MPVVHALSPTPFKSSAAKFITALFRKQARQSFRDICVLYPNSELPHRYLVRSHLIECSQRRWPLHLLQPFLSFSALPFSVLRQPVSVSFPINFIVCLLHPESSKARSSSSCHLCRRYSSPHMQCRSYRLRCLRSRCQSRSVQLLSLS